MIRHEPWQNACLLKGHVFSDSYPPHGNKGSVESGRPRQQANLGEPLSWELRTNGRTNFNACQGPRCTALETVLKPVTFLLPTCTILAGSSTTASYDANCLLLCLNCCRCCCYSPQLPRPGVSSLTSFWTQRSCQISSSSSASWASSEQNSSRCYLQRVFTQALVVIVEPSEALSLSRFSQRRRISLST